MRLHMCSTYLLNSGNCRYRAGGEEGERLFSAPDLQRSLGNGNRGQAQDAMRKYLAPVRAVQLVARMARLLLLGSAETGADEAALDLMRQKETGGADYAPPPPMPRGGGGSGVFGAASNAEVYGESRGSRRRWSESLRCERAVGICEASTLSTYETQRRTGDFGARAAMPSATV